MFMQHFDLMRCEFVRKIVIMNAKNTRVVAVVNMDLQAFGLTAGVIPRRFNAVFCN